MLRDYRDDTLNQYFINFIIRYFTRRFPQDIIPIYPGAIEHSSEKLRPFVGFFPKSYYGSRGHYSEYKIFWTQWSQYKKRIERKNNCDTPVIVMEQDALPPCAAITGLMSTICRRIQHITPSRHAPGAGHDKMLP
jgi:hypothetical protein